MKRNITIIFALVALVHLSAQELYLTSKSRVGGNNTSASLHYTHTTPAAANKSIQPHIVSKVSYSKMNIGSRYSSQVSEVGASLPAQAATALKRYAPPDTDDGDYDPKNPGLIQPTPLNQESLLLLMLIMFAFLRLNRVRREN